jgi:protein farnesyltransferase subunit beta
MSPTPSQLTAGLQWEPEPLSGVENGQVYDEKDRVVVLDPIFVVPVGVAARTRQWYEGRGF